MTIKQSAALTAILGAIALTGAGCFSTETPPKAPVVQEDTAPAPAEAEPRKESALNTSTWTRYSAASAGQIGMSFLYPPELTPVRWDTEAWGSGAIGTDFGGFGVARIPNVNRLSIQEWVSTNYPGFTFSFPEVDRDNPFYPAMREGMCQSFVVNDDFRNEAGLSGIGGTVFVDVGDASLYAFALGQDWNQELGDRETVIRAAMDSVEWFAEQTSCAHLLD